ncbi:hypothetical protein J1N35_012353 [Gossypium stocksii]|uniref:histone acetyltransferase n=1 Tax=Gossypium stocksii TaxID=47602 RepID=A0A9D4AE77_9ROSI|nr:hypothetical protein J1N35_012353 [Gossypium stocksii]
MVPNKWLPVGPRMLNSTYYDPSVADARFPFAGQNQSFCPVTEQAANHGYLPPLYLQEPLADATNRLNRAIQRKVLLAYIQYKNSAALSGNDAPAFFANYMHSTVCCQYVCRCTKFLSLASHYDGCHDARCDICSTVRYNAVVDTFRPDFEHVKGGLLRVTGSGDSGQPTYASSEAMQPLLKRLKLENPTAPSFPCDGMVYTMAPSNVQPSYAELPPLVQFSESPVSYNSEVTEVGVELLPKLLDGSTIANRMGMNMEVNTELPTSATEMDKTMEMNIELLPKPIEDSTSPKEMGHNMEEWSIELISKLMEDSPSAKEISMEEENIKLIPKLIEDSTSAKEIDMNMEEENVQLMSKLIEDSSNAKEMGKDVAESFPGPPEVAVAGYKVVETDPVGSHGEEDIGFINVTDNADNARDHFNNLEINAFPSFSEELAAGCEEGETEARANSTQAELATKTELIAQESNGGKEIKLESLKQRGVSLIENFTAQQIKEHISSLRECIDQDLGKKEGANRRVNVDSKNSCQLCGADKLSLAPAPIYCSSCCARIRRSAKYYSIPEVDGIRYCLCSSCYKLSRSESITTSGILVSKAKLIKKINDEEAEEWWVHCDKCKSWQHQICALFNEKKNKEKKDCFLCPKCCLEEIENGEHKPPLVKTVFGAKDLPPTLLSDHLEQRLFRCLQQNREEKAKAAGMSIDEVPEVEGLVVREVLSAQKLVKVNEKLLDILKDGNYPAEFPYKSKVILLFQKIDGADVCLFIMYAQEFGAECSQPNQRCVYISYLDSVKYFRPETETAAASGEPLRTVVYHEIMIMVDVPYDTDDNDASMNSGLFENRYRFLLFCQKNNYQFDTLRRAKHSSMMILYYLQNPTSLLAETTCCICDKDTPLNRCWHCKTCSEFFVCAACYHRHGCSLHVHKLSLHPSAVDSSAENRETLKKGLPKLLEILLHASGCDHCSHPDCRLLKKLFFHSKVCTVRAAGGCKHCKKIWFILRQHSRSCKESDCSVPRCRDIKQHAQSLALKPAAF